jgi:hypothetical protein
MRSRRDGTFVAIAAIWSISVLASTGAAPALAAPPAPAATSKRPQLVPLAKSVLIEPLLSAGDVLGRYQMSGVPDGLGAFRSSPTEIELYMNHELALSDDDPSDARISHLTLDNKGEAVAGEYVVDGSERFEEFCSATLASVGTTPWFFTGEEAPKSRRLGTSIALNTETGRYVQTPWFGHMYHENVVPVSGLDRSVVVVAEDGQAGRSQLYAFTSSTLRRAIDGTGSLRAWVPSDRTDANPSPDDIAKGQSMSGRFVRIPQRLNSAPNELEQASQAIGAFDFVRIEDAVASSTDTGVVYFADTGAAHQETFRGRIYKLTIDPSRPRRADLEVVLDADASDDLFNPDNLALSAKALVIQEDRNYAHSGYNRVLAYRFADETLEAVARTDPRPIAIERAGGPGAWESSGVIDASELFGEGWWLLDVQAGDVSVSVPGPSLEPGSAEGEGGQLLKVFIPDT